LAWPRIYRARWHSLTSGGWPVAEIAVFRIEALRAAELLLAEADVAAFSKAVELALFYDAILDVAAMA
jgi:hypothetical protein